MKKLILMVEDDFIEVLQDFKKNVNTSPGQLSDEKAMLLMSWWFMNNFNNNKKQGI